MEQAVYNAKTRKINKQTKTIKRRAINFFPVQIFKS